MSEPGDTPGDKAAARRDAAVRAFTQAALHFEGRGVPQDLERAAQLFRLAAELGHAKAQFNLGLMHARGVGVPADPKEAERWLRAAAEGGEAKAALALQQIGAPAPRPPSPQREPDAAAAVPTSASHASRKFPAWALPAAAGGAVVALAFAAWPFAREQFFPPRDLAELGARCETSDPYGRRVAFGATALPAAFKVSAKEACDVARTMTEQHRAEQDAMLDQLCGTLDGIVREFGAGDYDRAARTLAQRFGAGDPQVRPALALIAKCRTPAARGSANEEARKEIAARNARLAVYSVGQFVHDGRTCRGYVEEFASDQGTKPTQPWGVGYELRGYGDCAQVRIDAKEVFNPVRNPGGRLKGDLYREALKYDGALPATFSYRGVTYNFASATDAAAPPARDPWAGLPMPWGADVKLVKREAFEHGTGPIETRAGRLEVRRKEGAEHLDAAALTLDGKEITADWSVGLQYTIRLRATDLVLFYRHAGGNAVDPPVELLVLDRGEFRMLAFDDDKGVQHSPHAVLHDETEARFIEVDPWGGRLVWIYRDGKLAFAERREGQAPPATLPRQRAAADAEALPALGEVVVWHERRLGDLIVARPAVATKLGQLVPPDFDQCFADNHLYGFERSASGAIVIARSGARAEGSVKSLIYLHPSGQVHVILDQTDGNCAGVRSDRRPAYYYFTDADPASGRPKEVDEWLANYRDGSERVLWLAGNTVHEILKPVQARAAPPAAAPRQARPAPRPQVQAAGPRFRSDPTCQALQANADRIANSGMPPAVREKQLRMVYGGRAAQHCMR